MKLSLNYGFYKIYITVIHTQFEEDFFPYKNIGKSRFGEVFCV